MRFPLSLALFLACLTCLQAQPTHPPLDSATLAQQKEYTSIEEALKAEPLKVYKLNLYYKLIKKLPISIAQFRNLQVLDCSKNDLIALPSWIGKLTNLEKLNCGLNKLIVLPVEIGKLTNLKEFYCTDNQLTALPHEVGKWTKLQVLGCPHNRLTALPTNINELSNLTILHCNSNELTDLPTEISNLTKLTWVSCSFNRLTTLPAEIRKLIKLKKLDADYNLFSETEKQIIKKYLPNCEISMKQKDFNQIPEPDANWVDTREEEKLYEKERFSLAMLSQQKEYISFEEALKEPFNVYKLNLSEKGIEVLSSNILQFSNLCVLDCSHNSLKSLPDEIGKLGNLKELYLWSNQFPESEKQRIKQALPNCQIEF